MTRWLAALVALMSVACSAAGPDVTPTRGEQRSIDARTHRTPKAKPSRDSFGLAFVKKDAIHVFDLDTHEDREILQVPGPDVVLSPDGSQVAIVTDLDPGGDPEGLSKPEISVVELAGESGKDLGPGEFPQWSPDGTELAARTDEGIAIYDVTSGAHELAVAGDWSLSGWNGGDVVVLSADGVFVASPGSDARKIYDRNAHYWATSPSEPEMLTVHGSTAAFTGFDGSARGPIELPGGLGAGTWSPDGSVVAGVLLANSTSLALLYPDGTVTEVPDGIGAQGNVVWAADSKTFAFVRVDPDDRLKLQAVVCEVDGTCASAFSWGQGVSLLGFTSA
jgi:hypothetical protein